MPEPPAANIPLTDVYVCGVMDDPTAPLPKPHWSPFATQSAGAAVRMPSMQGSGDYHTICGPVLAMTPGATLLAFAEGRRDARGDFGDIDIILRRSTDRGATLERYPGGAPQRRRSDRQPCPIVDHDTGRIHLLSCTGVEEELDILTGSSYREVWLSTSDDDGATWSRRRNISPWHVGTTGTGMPPAPRPASRSAPARYRGRLVAPANHSYLLPDGSHEYACHSLYSDDRGETWHRGSVSAPGGNENQIAEAGDDLLIQDIRLQTNRTGYRGVRYSRDGGATWDALRSDPAAPAPAARAASSPWRNARTAATTSWWRATRRRSGAASRAAGASTSSRGFPPTAAAPGPAACWSSPPTAATPP